MGRWREVWLIPGVGWVGLNEKDTGFRMQFDPHAVGFAFGRRGGTRSLFARAYDKGKKAALPRPWARIEFEWKPATKTTHAALWDDFRAMLKAADVDMVIAAGLTPHEAALVWGAREFGGYRPFLKELDECGRRVLESAMRKMKQSRIIENPTRLVLERLIYVEEEVRLALRGPDPGENRAVANRT